MKTIKQLLLLVIIVFGISIISYGQQAKPWDVPAKFKTMKNPVKSDQANINTGKDLFNRNCSSCHGKTGLGDGPKAKVLKTSTGNFTQAEFQNQSDGDLFYKTKTGRGEMTKFEGKIDDESIWMIIHYMRTFKK
jgi:mono/diheme cytochrome c family protein